MSVRNYKYSLRNNPEQSIFQYRFWLIFYILKGFGISNISGLKKVILQKFLFEAYGK
jgi:hypothetical protein